MATTAAGNSSSVAASAASNAPLARRMENVTVCLPLIRGSVASYLGNEANEFQTHRWTLYLRGPNNEDLTQVISKVVFQLHPSFAEPTREQTAPPYELTETGWGEFEAQIKVYWKDPSENPVMVNVNGTIFG
jgi:YEATS domain-containing protein 4